MNCHHLGLVQLMLLLPLVFQQELVDQAYPGLVGRWRFKDFIWEKVEDDAATQQPSTVEVDADREGRLFYGGSNEILRVKMEKFLGIETAKEKEESNEGGAPDWGYYGRQGTEYWGSINHNCLGNSQSPINMDNTLVVQENVYGRRIQFLNYEYVNARTTLLENNGHTVELKVVNPPREPTMSGGHLQSTYTMVQLHFHWAATDAMGSEHTIDRLAAPLEMHLVHLASDIARDQMGGLAVAGFIFQISYADNPAIQAIIEGIQRIRDSHQETHLKDPQFNVARMIQPAVSGPYYSYGGSLTTPGCDEVVQWVLFSTPLTISSRQLAAFRTVLDNNGERIMMNFRPVQPLNDRTVVLYSK